MTFLAPSILWGLFAAAIPIIIHLISLRHTREIEFGTLRFIKELEHEVIRRLKLRQWLLVLLRTLAVISLVLMFARPVQHGIVPDWIAGESESRIVIFVDNSASMSLETDNGTLLENSLSIIPQIVNSFEGQPEIEIFQTNPVKRVFKGQSGELTSRSALRSITQTISWDRLWTVVDSVLTAMDVDEPNRECFILSDFQSAPDPDTFLKKLNPDSSATPWRFYFIGQEELKDNLSIREVEAVSQIRLPNHVLKLNTLIANDGKREKRNHPVELYLNGDRVGQVVSTFQPQKTKEFLFQAYPGKSGLVKGLMEIPDDDFDLDNKQTFEVAIPEQIAIMIIGSSKEETYLLELALSAIDNRSGFLYLDSRTDPNLERVFLDESDVLILYNPGKLSDNAVEGIQNLLRRGGGVIWFAGDRQVGKQNSRAETTLKLPVTSDWTMLAGEAYFSVTGIAEEHPLLTDLDLRDLESELPQVYGFVKVTPRNNQQVIFSLNNGFPLLIDCPSNGGHIFYFTALMDLKWSDLAVRGLAVPLLHRILLLLATDESNSRPVFVDENKIITIDRKSINSQWTLVTPTGKTILLIPDYNKESLVIKETSELGSYEILADGLPYAAFSTRLAPSEYPSVRADRTRILKLLPSGQTRWLEATKNLSSELKELRQGKSLWRTFLILAIILLLLESLLGRTKPEALKHQKN